VVYVHVFERHRYIYLEDAFNDLPRGMLLCRQDIGCVALVFFRVRTIIESSAGYKSLPSHL
jgi:hypothetical protein